MSGHYPGDVTQADVDRAAPQDAPPLAGEVCQCGHAVEAHGHARRGDPCDLIGCRCPHFEAVDEPCSCGDVAPVPRVVRDASGLPIEVVTRRRPRPR